MAPVAENAITHQVSFGINNRSAVFAGGTEQRHGSEYQELSLSAWRNLEQRMGEISLLSQHNITNAQTNDQNLGKDDITARVLLLPPAPKARKPLLRMELLYEGREGSKFWKLRKGTFMEIITYQSGEKIKVCENCHPPSLCWLVASVPSVGVSKGDRRVGQPLQP